jgi:transcriptional regulator with XRE-family HTH domain
MARTALGWTVADLAARSTVKPSLVTAYEDGATIRGEHIEAMRRAFEEAGCRFIMSGQFKGAVVPPAPTAIEDKSGGNPLMPRPR